MDKKRIHVVKERVVGKSRSQMLYTKYEASPEGLETLFNDYKEQYISFEDRIRNTKEWCLETLRVNCEPTEPPWRDESRTSKTHKTVYHFIKDREGESFEHDSTKNLAAELLWKIDSMMNENFSVLKRVEYAVRVGEISKLIEGYEATTPRQSKNAKNPRGNKNLVSLYKNLANRKRGDEDITSIWNHYINDLRACDSVEVIKVNEPNHLNPKSWSVEYKEVEGSEEIKTMKFDSLRKKLKRIMNKESEKKNAR